MIQRWSIADAHRTVTMVVTVMRAERGEAKLKAVKQAVDGPDAQRVTDGVHQEDQAVVPGARRRVLRA